MFWNKPKVDDEQTKDLKRVATAHKLSIQNMEAATEILLLSLKKKEEKTANG